MTDHQHTTTHRYQGRPITAIVDIDWPKSGRRRFNAGYLVSTWPTFDKGSELVAAFASEADGVEFCRCLDRLDEIQEGKAEIVQLEARIATLEAAIRNAIVALKESIGHGTRDVIFGLDYALENEEVTDGTG